MKFQLIYLISDILLNLLIQGSDGKCYNIPQGVRGCFNIPWGVIGSDVGFVEYTWE